MHDTRQIQLYTPPDLDEAVKLWNANCGPASLAAALRCPLSAVREFFPRFPGKPWTNPTHMLTAIRLSKHEPQLTQFSRRTKRGRSCPTHGVMFLQFSSPEIDASHILTQYKKTHWIATEGESGGDRPYAIYDINAGTWIPPLHWEEEIWPRFQEATGATTFYARSAYEIF